MVPRVTLQVAEYTMDTVLRTRARWHTGTVLAGAQLWPSSGLPQLHLAKASKFLESAREGIFCGEVMLLTSLLARTEALELRSQVKAGLLRRRCNDHKLATTILMNIHIAKWTSSFNALNLNGPRWSSKWLCRAPPSTGTNFVMHTGYLSIKAFSSRQAQRQENDKARLMEVLIDYKPHIVDFGAARVQTLEYGYMSWRGGASVFWGHLAHSII